jgi:hypothetical protein
MDNYENTIQQFNQNFLNIIKINNECFTNKTTLKQNLSVMKEKHTKINKNNKPIFLFCLDSFLYQYKIFAFNLDNFNKLWILHNNRMYGDYYKLYNIIVKYMKSDNKFNINDLSGNTFPIYKELDQDKEFNIDDITNVHNAILELIKQISIVINSNNNEISNYNLTNKVGFSISNYINTLNYENLITISQNTLYINYMSFFHISQKKHLDALNQNIMKVILEISENSNIDHMFSIIDIDKELQINDTNPNTNPNMVDCSTNTIDITADNSANLKSKSKINSNTLLFS